MDLLTLFRLFRRNIGATVVAAALAGALVAFVVVSAPPVYRSSGSVVLFSPPQPPDLTLLDVDPSVPTTTVASDNPYVRFNDLSVVVDIIRRVLLSTEVDATVREAGVTGVYTVAANIDFYRGPIIDIADEAATPHDAQRSTEIVMAQLGESLDALQAQQGTDPEYRIKAQAVVMPNPGTRVYSSTMRRAMAVMVLAAGMGVGLVVLSDTLRRWRRGRNANRAEPEPGDDMSALDDDLRAAGIDLKIVSAAPDRRANPRPGRRRAGQLHPTASIPVRESNERQTR